MGPTVFASPSPRHRAAARLAALALTVLALGACSGEGADDGTGRADAAASSPAPATASASASSSAPPPARRSGTPSSSYSAQPPASDGPSDAPSPKAPARWAGGKQFVQVDNAWIKDGRTYLSVRSARREALTGPIEGWEIIPGKGPYTTVRMAPEGRVLLSVPLGDESVPHTYSQAQFITRWWALPAPEREWQGYDVSFDLNGEVVRLQSLYRA
ncbi:hypothetical protein OG539_23005 [Actinacidiphila glaucinigra]|uniref:hypothetical protein n=1 Tax=Actinacidiphila glaucinigra TaxID=235986 RepID=UPI002DD92982|nr:hypothetical protein [Actinacidiphila glaucinigra]WSD61004.1 hypothetical protein OIE69_19860 [Actinacidiphila glaucinigra]